MKTAHSISRQSGDKLIVTQAQRQVQTFFDELKNGTQNYRTIASLDAQIAQAYRGRCVMELLQNAHDALEQAPLGDRQQVSFVMRTGPEPALLVANTGVPFRHENFIGLCQLGQSPKDPNESVGNKGLGFRSVLEVATSPEIWSREPVQDQASFVFRFDPSVSGQIAAAAEELQTIGLDAQSPFDPDYPLLDWSDEQLDQYLDRMTHAGLEGSEEARGFLSPYLIPLPIQGLPEEVETLWEQDHVTVVRLPLDGGGAATSDDAIESVREQLDALDAQAAVFLSHVERLVIDIDGEQRILERLSDTEVEVSACTGFRRERLLVEQSGPDPDCSKTREFHIWTRIMGGDDDPEQAERIRAMVEHLPNRWPEVRRVTVSVAVEEGPSSDTGRFVIFLPTEMATGTGAHINAPFYGSLDRRQIDFGDPYNDLLLRGVLDLCLDAVSDLLSGPSEEWRARAVIDLLASSARVDGDDWRIMDELVEQATRRNQDLGGLKLILCDHGWCAPGNAREMPDVPDDSPIGSEHWRTRAAFAIISTALEGRRTRVRALVKRLDGSLEPTPSEWLQTADRVALGVRDHEIDVGWNAFLNSLVAVLPDDLQAEPRADNPDPLAAARILPDQDGRLLSASDHAKLFFQPVRGVDDAAELVGHVPRSLQNRVAFLHPDVQTQQGPQRRNTPVQKFLDGRFARRFRREDLIREVVLPAIPTLPAAHGGQQAGLCSDLLAWTMQILGEDPSQTLLPLLPRLPIACHSGWIRISDAVFGPGWPNRLGDDVWLLAGELPPDDSTRLRGSTLLPSDDPRWGFAVRHLDGLFRRMGVFDGLRLGNAPDIPFHMQIPGYELPSATSSEIPQDAWDEWRHAVSGDAKPDLWGYFLYFLSEVSMVPEIYCLESLTPDGRRALSRLLLASIPLWPDGWHQVTIEKRKGYYWSTRTTSPLKFWLTTQPWLIDGTTGRVAVADRWLIPTSLLRGQRERYRHLEPLSLDLSRRLEEEPELKSALAMLGLNVYPVEDDRIGPELLEALATAWSAGNVLVGFDVFLGQVRDAWRHFDPEKELPETLLVRTGHRAFETRPRDELTDVYLPDSRDRTRSLLAHRKPILEMNPKYAGRLADALLSVTGIRRSSLLTERAVLDGKVWTGAADDLQSIEESTYKWLPVILLAIAAYGGAEPTGAATERWGDAAQRLRRARIVNCEDIAVQLMDEDNIVAETEPPAEWLPGDVLAVRRDTDMKHDKLATAGQAILDRQDLLRDLRLVLAPLAGQENPTLDQIEAALERAEIDAEAFADIQNRWAGTLSLVVDRIRPVLVLLDIRHDGFDVAAADIESLTEWLASNVPGWPVSDLLSVARSSRDDREMGHHTWLALGHVAQLPSWNEALTTLGERYEPVENLAVQDQVDALIEMARPLLRCLARHIAIKEGNPNLFPDLEGATRDFEVHPEWTVKWWEIPFTVVMNALQARYAEVPGAEYHLTVLETIENVDDLRVAFKDAGIETDCNPYEIARQNTSEFGKMLRDLHDLHGTWIELEDASSRPPEPPDAPDDPEPEAYLKPWTETELLHRGLRCIGACPFVDACAGCMSLDDIRKRLGLDPAAVDAKRRQREEKEREDRRKQRTIPVAGFPVEVGATTFMEIFEHLQSLPLPAGPQASLDSFTELDIPGAVGRRTGQPGGAPGGRTGTHSPQSREFRQLVGAIGEMHAYRFLQQEFGSEAITPDAWVSKIRKDVLPLVPGESDNASDSHGFDFRFTHRRKHWLVEVKSTKGDETQFDLGVTEIEAAIWFANPRRRGYWRVLRVRNALSGEPEFDWLPNPFQEGFKDRFRIREGGMSVSYRRKKP
ncbi:MAG: hypothetical protein F4Z15_00415 [Gammaproteobacteria bacterium]|nr:hypothetical protein [Gammaproteobacteria bacterium]